MNPFPLLGKTAPTALSGARSLAHHAVQHITRAARANLNAEPDDSHSNLGWHAERQAFLSHPMATKAGPIEVGLCVPALRLFALQNGSALEELTLHGLDDAGIALWLDAVLLSQRLTASGSAKLPYDAAELAPHSATAGGVYNADGQTEALVELAGWYQAAQCVLEEIRVEHRNVARGASAVRCWPHHFDMATLIRVDESGEKARSIGVGFSPGDASYAQPYFYVSPWPYPQSELLNRLARGHWHSEAFTAAVLCGADIVAEPRHETAIREFLSEALTASRRALGV